MFSSSTVSLYWRSVLAQLAAFLAPVPDGHDPDRVAGAEGAPLQQAGLAVDRVDRLVDVGALDSCAQGAQPRLMRFDVGLEDGERIVGDVPPVEAALQHVVVAADDRVGVDADHLALLHDPVRVHDVADAAPVGSGLDPAHVEVVDLDVGEAPAKLVLDRDVGGPRHLHLGHAGAQRLQRRVAEQKEDYSGKEISSEDVKLYFVLPEGDEAHLSDLHLNTWGEIENWPDEFFGDEMGEISAITEASLRRRIGQAE